MGWEGDYGVHSSKGLNTYPRKLVYSNLSWPEDDKTPSLRILYLNRVFESSCSSVEVELGYLIQLHS